MASTLTLLTILPALAAVAVVVRARSDIRGTSLTLAGGWCLAAALAMSAAWFATAVFPRLESPWDDVAWYIVAELLLCPLIAVLGARRPGVAVWNWFVLLPLLMVLGWPVAVAASSGGAAGSFSLEAPPLLGLLLVLLMGCGNYVGTRFVLPVLLLAGAVLLLILPLAPGIAWPLTADASRLLAVWCVGGAALTGRLAARRVRAGASGPDRVWRDFRDQFGIVWAQRVQERINERAGQERWDVRLDRRGFVPHRGAGVTGAVNAREQIDHALRWLLRRFVDDAWLDERLGTSRSEVSRSGPEESRPLPTTR